jgi:hypothetical protein
MFLILSLAVLIGMGLATTAAIAGKDGPYGQIRWRWEGFKDYDADSDLADGWGQNLLRSRLGYFTHVGERGMFNVSMENVHVLGGDWGYGYYNPFGYETTKEFSVRSFGEDVHIHQAWLGYQDFLFEDFDAYGGRMSLAYGRERIIGREDWSMNAEYRFDGFKGHYMFEDGWFDLLCMWLYEWGPTRYADGIGDVNMRGIYFHYDANEEFWFEPYILWITQTNSDYGLDTTQDPPDRFTGLDNDSYWVFGALLDYMTDMGLHLYAEGTLESGTEHYDADTKWDWSALGFYAGGFYEFDSEVEPFLGVEFNYASGTEAADLDNSEWKTFFSPFGSFSDFMGRMNFVGWSNTATLRFSGGLTPTEGLDLAIDFYMFKLAKDEDYAYFNHNFAMFYEDMSVWPGDMVDGVFDKSVGTEIDFFANYTVEEGVDVEGGLGIFSPGDYFGADADLDSIWFAWLGAQVGFH